MFVFIQQNKLLTVLFVFVTSTLALGVFTLVNPEQSIIGRKPIVTDKEPSIVAVNLPSPIAPVLPPIKPIKKPSTINVSSPLKPSEAPTSEPTNPVIDVAPTPTPNVNPELPEFPFSPPAPYSPEVPPEAKDLIHRVCTASLLGSSPLVVALLEDLPLIQVKEILGTTCKTLNLM